MNKIKKILSIFIATVILFGVCSTTVLTASAETTEENVFTSGDYIYSIGSEGAVIQEYTGSDTVVEIPSVLDGNQVCEIGKYAFVNNETIESVVIPDGVLAIRTCAFYWCTNLKNLSIPASVTQVDILAFDESPFFENCKKNDNFFIVGDGVLYWCNKTLSEVVVPDSVKYITDFVFQGSIADTLALSDNISEIPSYAFQGSHFTSITLGSGLKYINNNAFENCSDLKYIKIPDSVISLGAEAFLNCTALEIADIGNIERIATSLFKNCTNLKNLISNELSLISWRAFENCSSLESVKLSDKLSSIDWYAFYNCSSLNNIVIPESCKDIDFAAFAGCTSLDNISIPKSVTSIGADAFNRTAFLENYPEDYVVLGDGILIKYKGTDSVVNIPDGVKIINEAACYEMKFIEEVNIPNTVTRIENFAFTRCNIKEIKLPKNLQSIGNYAFHGCNNLTEVTIPESVTRIERGAFCSCDALQSIVVPKSVTKIGTNAFSYCNDGNVTVYGYEGSYVQQYAKDNSINFSALSVPGDVNNDGKITVADAIMLQKHIANIISLPIDQKTTADVNNDIKITVADAIMLQKHIANIIKLS